MTSKAEVMALVRDGFARWDRLLSGLSEAWATAPQAHTALSIKDEVAHLWAWQQRSIARLEAALEDRQPVFPSWPAELEEEKVGEPHAMNAWIYETNRDRPWADVVAAWRAGFLRFLELGEAVPEPDLMQPGRYAWLAGHPLAYILEASYEHHHEDHLGPLEERLGRTDGDH
jgi:hypothetical protein